MAADPTLSQVSEQLRIGDTFPTSSRTITEADIVAFATQTGDLHPLHVDAEWSSGTPFGERIAPGALVLSYSLGLVRWDPERVVALRGLTDVVFVRPVKIGDTLSAECRVAGAAPEEAGAGIVILTLVTSNQQQRTVCRARLQVNWRGDPPARLPTGGYE